ncbi:MAG TPA: poly-gamma-glutamate biosynthesis protein PgsC [Pirellulales bacterium]|jgi:poly-gamma-glutamate biosynthesis protein PgsC/CapC|nr:poly-gamma-glutamate biosynthesis protein PgsC [Pirellulales bacterium]
MELLTVSIGLGLAVGLLFSELFALAAGGLVVPGYIALSLSHPLDVALTIGVGMASAASAMALGQCTILDGKRRTVVTILVGYILGMTLDSLAIGAPLEFGRHGLAHPAEVSVIGYVIPGLIGTWIDRQGLVETVSTLLTAAVVVRLLLILLYGAEALP